MKIKIIIFAKILFVLVFFFVALMAHENFTAEERIDRGPIAHLISFVGFAASFPLSFLYFLAYAVFFYFLGEISFESYISWMTFYLAPIFSIGYYQWFILFPCISPELNNFYKINLLKAK